MTEDAPPPEAPGPRRTRLIVGLGGAVLMAASGFFAEASLGYADGSHGPVFAIENIGRTVILVLAALLGAGLVLQPQKPDVRIARAGVLAVGLIGIVAGLEAFLGAPDAAVGTSAIDARAGPGAWMLVLSGMLFVVLRWWRGVWPESRWEHLLRSGLGRRR